MTAMSAMTADQAATILHYTLPRLKVEHDTTTRVIAAIPPGKADFRPDQIAKSAIDLAWHIVTAENRFLEATIAGAFDLTPVPRPDAIQTPDEVNRWYTERYDRNIARLQQLSGDELVRIVDFRGIFQLPAVLYLQTGVSHTVHHRGQLSMYLRPMGAKVPSIYGESYDARVAREAAAQTAKV
jgi:uncharacterized damage-inducible protein DinB